ncbi:hypothetical protein FRC06_010100, partial [Ceratobasidium sp. 370]
DKTKGNNWKIICRGQMKQWQPEKFYQPTEEAAVHQLLVQAGDDDWLMMGLMLNTEGLD